MILFQINSVVNYGSTGRIVEDIGKIADENGWENYVAYGRYNNESHSNLIKIGSNFDIKCHGVQTRLFDRHGLGSCNSTKKLIEKIKLISPDIIHLHNIHGYYLNFKELFRFLSVQNIPVVWTLHDCWPMTGHCTHFDLIGCYKWENQCFKCPQKKEYPSSYFMDGSKRNYSIKKKSFTSLNNLTIISVSDWLNKLVEKSFLSRYERKVIYNGVNTDLFKPIDPSFFRQKFDLDGTIILLGVANVWNNRKGLMDFIELSKALNSDYKIILIGLNKKQIKYLPKNIIGIGRTQNINELVQIYSSADVLINATWEDNFPTTNIEALSCGTPIISYNTGGSPEAIDNRTGFIVEKGSIKGLIESISLIKQKGKKYFSSSCRDRAVKLFDKNDRYMDYINLYESILQGNKT